MSDLEIISAEVCPFAQRSLIALLEKGANYLHTEIDLRNKPVWFADVSPYSKVPVLRHGDVRVYESAIINEYLDEVLPQPALMPKDAGARAQARIWIDFDNVKFVPAFYKVLLAQEATRRGELATTIADALRFIETAALGARATGPYWLGREFTLVDIAVWPHMERLAVLEAYRGIKVPKECGRLREWLAAVAERASVKDTAHDGDYHVRAYSRYADGTADGTTARDMRL
jgi:glutathione S-transferase